VAIPLTFYEPEADAGATVRLYIHTMREDALAPWFLTGASENDA
jgi:hypothetical protein